MLATRSTLVRLKADTAPQHMHAERHVRILDSDADLRDYIAYLRAFYGFHAPLESRFATHQGLATAGFNASRRSRSPLIERDLRSLGEVGPYAACADLPDPVSVAAALGVAYVLEGSTLGGRYIQAHLPPALAGMPTAFLTGYGDETGAMWRAFGAIVDAEVTTPELQDETIAAARGTFAALTDWLALRVPMDASRGRRQVSA